MFVKICGLSTEEHVQVAVDAGADAAGFVFADSVRKVDPAHAASITKSVPDTIKKVAVMLHPSNDEWLAVLNGFKPDVLQTDLEDFANLEVPEEIECWPVYRQGIKVTVPEPGVSLIRGQSPYLYEGARSGAGETVDWAAAAKVAEGGQMILAGGLSIANVAEAIEIVRPFGVDVSSAVESAPGQKDPELIRKFVNAAKAAGNDL